VPRAALDYVSADRGRAVLFVYQLKDAAVKPVKPRGLDPRNQWTRRRRVPAGAGRPDRGWRNTDERWVGAFLPQAIRQRGDRIDRRTMKPAVGRCQLTDDGPSRTLELAERFSGLSFGAPGSVCRIL
jgi:hypothetical protein